MESRRESSVVILMRALPPAVVGAMMLQIAVAVGCLIIGALAAGMFADAHFGTKPLFTLLLALVGVFASVWLTYRIAIRTSKKAREAYQAYLTSTRATALSPQTAPLQGVQASDPLARALSSDR